MAGRDGRSSLDEANDSMRYGHAEDGPLPILPAGSVIAIVDPFSSGRFLAPALRERGYRPIAVISDAEFGPDCFATFKPGDYDAILAESDAGFEDRLRTLQPAAVIAG